MTTIPAQVLSPATTYDIDVAHSAAHFKVKHLMIATVRGNMNLHDGHVQYDPADPTQTRIVANLSAKTINTNEQKRDAHLRSADFLDADNHPTLHYESHNATRIDDDNYRVDGQLTIRGVTHPATLEVQREGEATDPWGRTKIALTARTTINRTKWGLTWNSALETGGVLVGDDVKIELNLQLVQNK